MRVLVIASEVPPVRSGVARSVGHIVCGLRERGHRVDLISADDAPAVRGDEVRLSGMALKLPWLVRSMRGYDVVNLHGPAPTISDVVLAGWRLGGRRPPLVYTHHFTVWVEAGWLQRACDVYDRATRRLAQAASHLIVTTDSYRQLLDRECSPPINVIEWGVESERFRSERDRYDGTRPLRVLLLGQLRRYKGALIAVDAVAHRPELSLTLAGRGPLEPTIRERIRGVPNVELRTDLGDDELPALFAGHDVVALPSTNRLEAFGIALLEGMAAGCVPVASDLPGVRDTAGMTGRVVPSGDPVALRQCLLELAADPDEVDKRSRRSVDVATTLTWARTVERYEQVLSAVAG